MKFTRKMVLCLFMVMVALILTSCSSQSPNGSSGANFAVSGSAFTQLQMNMPINTSWTTTDPYSVHHWVSGCYAKYYNFTLTSTTSVQIDLEAPSYNYLFLLRGADQNGEVIASSLMSADKYGSEIIATNLAPGTYTIEAANYWANTVGDFTIGVGTVTNSPVTRWIDYGSTEQGRWVYSNYRGLSRSTSYVKYYKFNVSGASNYYPRRVHIEVTGSTNPYIFLTAPYYVNGSTCLAYSSGDGARAWIDYSITRDGDHKIEVDTYQSTTIGTFTVSLR